MEALLASFFQPLHAAQPRQPESHADEREKHPPINAIRSCLPLQLALLRQGSRDHTGDPPTG